MHVKKLEKNDWRAYKALRLEALGLHPDVYGGTLQDALQTSDSDWQQVLDRQDQAYFGLYEGGELIGCGGVFMQDAASKTGMLIGGYIRAQYRGRGLSHMIYEARIGWTKESGLYDRLVVGHRKGNEASRRANQVFGFKYIGEEDYLFGDGTRATHLQYEMRIK